MELLGKGSVPQGNFCEWCSAVGTNRCSRCHAAYYCCHDHQVNHWTVHKKVCKKYDSTGEAPSALNVPSDLNVGLDNFSYGGWCQNNMPCDKGMSLSNIELPAEVYNTASTVISDGKSLDFPIPDEDEIFSSLSSELLSSDNNFWDIISTCDTENISDYSMYLEKDGIPNQFSESYKESPLYNQQENSTPQMSNAEDPDIMHCASLHDICANVVHDLNTYGICVLDRFIGSRFGSMILEEVKNLYSKGIFRKGELVNPSPYMSKENVRCDVTTWVDGTEPGCKYIGSLIRKLDVVVTTCNKMQNNGLLSQYKLHRRTKAMLACYPGDGTYYKKHVDNPHKDGRCITCIYYLNQNWDVKQHGGLLRMFPSAHDSQVANIQPIFDRMLFFWSDKRNPHEVLPSFATRFAITVWYFDADERDRALIMYRERALHSRSQNFMN